MLASTMQTTCVCCGSPYFWPFGGACPNRCDPDAEQPEKCPQCGHPVADPIVELFDGTSTRNVCEDCGHVWDWEETEA